MLCSPREVGAVSAAQLPAVGRRLRLPRQLQRDLWSAGRRGQPCEQWNDAIARDLRCEREDAEVAVEECAQGWEPAAADAAEGAVPAGVSMYV